MELPLKIDLTGKVAVVTGGGGVLCSVLAEALARCGAKVALLDRSAAGGHPQRLRDMGLTVNGYRCDVLDKESIVSCHKQILSDFGPCDILINGAGGNNPRANTDKEYFEPGDIDGDTKSFFDLEREGFEAVFNLNFLGTLLTTQVFAADMLSGKPASVINISSMSAYAPLTKVPAYSGAKSAINNFTSWLAVHFKNTGIRVNAIAPGFFVTSQNRDLLFDGEGKPTARTEKILAATPMGRFGEAEELVGTLLWLVDSKASGFVTGVVIPVDGGFNAYSGV